MNHRPYASTTASAGESARSTHTPAAAGEQHAAAQGSQLPGGSMSPMRILQLQQVIGNRSVAQLLSRSKSADHRTYRRQPLSGSGAVVQRWAEEDSDETIVDEVLLALEALSSRLGFNVEVDKTDKRVVLSSLYNSSPSIEIAIQPLSEAEAGQPVFVGHGSQALKEGAKPYTLYVVKKMDQQQLGPLLLSAVRQIRDWASGTPGWIDTSGSEQSGESATEPSVLRSGVRKLEDQVEQSIQTNVPDTALWGTLVSWLPHLEGHKDSKELGAQFSAQVTTTAAALKLTVSAATRFLTELGEFYLRFHCTASDRDSEDMPLKLLQHCHMVTEKARLSREAYLKRLKETASNTDDDFEKAGRNVSSGNTAPPEPPKVEPPVSVPVVPDIQVGNGPQQQGNSPGGSPGGSSGDSSGDASDLDDWFGALDFDSSGSEEEVPVKDEYESLFTSGKIRQELHDQLEKELDEQREARGELFSRINVFCKGGMTEEVFITTVKNITEKTYVQDFNTRYGLGLTLPDNFTEKPVKKLELRDTLPSKQTIENAVDAYFISSGEADFLVARLGFHTAARMISYYRKNNAMSAIRGLIDQLKRTLGHVERSEDKEELLSPLTDKSLVIDTNIAKALLMEAADMNPEERRVSETAGNLLKGGTVDEIRLPNMVIGELVQFGSNVFALGAKKTGIPWRPMPIGGKRDSSSRQGQYASDLHALERQQVGGAKGAPDRQLVVDSLHALTENDSVGKRLVTADKGIIKHLHELYVKQVEERNKSWTGTGSPPQPVDQDQPFELEMGGRRLTIVPVDATVKEDDKQTDYYSPEGIKAEPVTRGNPLYTPITAPTDGPGATLFGKLIGKEEANVQVKDLIELIAANGYDVAFVGGSVRDSVRGESPKDIDVTTNMDIDSLIAMLKKDDRFSSIPQNIVKTEKMHLLQLAIQSQNSVDITCAMRPQDEKAKSFDEEGFYENDAKKRDFTMNALYVDKTGKLHDPTGRGVSDALSKNLFSLVEGFVQELEDMLSYDQLGRLMKFSARNYTVAEEQLAFVRKRMVELVYKARNDKEMGATKLSHILERARERTPGELIEVLRGLGFSDKLIRQLFPDSPAGFYEDGTPNFKHGVLPGRLDNPQTKDLPDDGLPDVKFDAETGRLYQYRMFVQDKDKTDLIADMDMTDHGMEGHTPPHYHLYRWIENEQSGKGEWDKHQQGLSATGEPGRPSIEGGQYVGPRPWTWTDKLKDTQPADEWIKLMQEQMAEDGVTMDIADKGGGLLLFGGEITVHIDKIREMQGKNKLSELLMFVAKTAEKGKLPYEQDMSSLSLISSGGERLRFNKHRFAISSMLEEWGVSAVPAEEAHWIRLFDLLYYTKQDDQGGVAAKAAAWAEEHMSGNWFTFVERFEFYMASAAKASVEPATSDVDEQYNKLSVTFKPGEQLSAQSDYKTSLSAHLGEIIKSAESGKLGFVSESAAKYHYLKHAEELREKSGASDYDFGRYVQDAQSTIAEGKTTGSDYEQLGSQAFIFVKDENKAIVRVETDGTAHLASFYAIRKKERDEEGAQEHEELFQMPSGGGSADKESDKGGGGSADINRLFGSLEFFVQGAATHYGKGEGEQALRQAKAARQVLDDIILPMFYAKMDGLKPDYVEETIKRITSFREQVDFLTGVGGQLKEQQTIEALIETMGRDIKLMETEIEQTVKALEKAGEQGGNVQPKPEWMVQMENTLRQMQTSLESKKSELERLGELARQSAAVDSGSDSGESPKGLANIGNSCYIGSIMQFMALDDTYANLFINPLPPGTTPLVVQQLQLHGRLIIQKLQAKQAVAAEELAAFRKSLLDNGWLQGDEARIATQQDAAELFGFLTDKLRLRDKLDVTTSHELQDSLVEEQTSESMLVLSNLEEGVDLSTLVERNAPSVVERFRDESNVPSIRRFRSLPEVLTIQIARFQYSRELQRVVKIDLNVPVPDQKLMVSEDLIEDEDQDEDVEYTLESFILHIGDSPTRGHYVGYFVREGRWYGYNDSVVRPVSEEEVNAVSSKAYLLRFRKN